MKVVLVANYLPDAQQSMQRFAAMLQTELPGFGVEVEVIRPAARANLRQGRRGVDKYFGYIDKLLLFPRELRRRLRSLASDTVVHICDHSNAFYTKSLRGVPHLVTCHDLLAVRSARGEFPRNTTGWSGRRLQSMIVNGLNAAQRVACVSDATRSDVLRCTTLEPNKVEVIYNGLNYQYEPMPESEALSTIQKLGIAQRFILHVGGDHWYKNRTGVLEIFAALPEERRPLLVIVGDPLSSEHARWVREHNLERRVIVLHGASNEQLRALYSTAALMLFPSWIEGFGWPIAEAQACGCPVVTTFHAPMTEVGGHAAVYINPEKVGQATDTISGLLKENHAVRQVRIADSIANSARFSTERMIEGYLAAYQALLGHKPFRQVPVLG